MRIVGVFDSLKSLGAVLGTLKGHRRVDQSMYTDIVGFDTFW